MRVKRSDDQRLVVVAFPLWIGAIGFPIALFLLYRAVLCLVRGDPQRSEMIICLIGFVVSFVAAGFLTTRSVFDFDLVRKQLKWRRLGIFGSKRGTVFFSQILWIDVECNKSGEDGPSYRIVLQTSGGTIPMTNYSSTGQKKYFDQLSSQIADTLGLCDFELDEKINSLVKLGRTVDAIPIVRDRYRFDTAQAKRCLDGLCIKCGYDLRSTLERCPECGTVATVLTTDSNV